MIGKRLAHYEVLEKIGSGGMGEVYRARDTRLDRDVALKVLPPDMANDPDRSARFEREARMIAALKHPNIITIHAVEEVDGVRFLAMEFVAGRTLTGAIPAGSLTLNPFLDLAIPLADAVAAAHAFGHAAHQGHGVRNDAVRVHVDRLHALPVDDDLPSLTAASRPGRVSRNRVVVAVRKQQAGHFIPS